MHITVSGKQVETGKALKVHVADGLGLIARKYFDHALEAQVTFHRGDHGFFGCDINLHAGRGLSMRAEGEGADAHRAFEEAAEHIAKRLRRFRRRANEHSRSQAETRAVPVQMAEDAEDDADVLAEAAAPEAPHGLVVAEVAAELSVLSVKAAVERLDLSDGDVLVFRNSATDAVNVLYRRRDGNLGWIDPCPG